MTPAVLIAKKAKIHFEIHEYQHNPDAQSYGLDAAEKLSVNPDKVFKTLVVSAESKRLFVVVLPVSRSLNLKLAAKAFGLKKLTMAEHVMVERSTGYVLGGVSPLGQKKRLATVIDTSATHFDSILISAGKRGSEIELSPHDLCTLTCAEFYALVC